jgi:hypothetical protein
MSRSKKFREMDPEQKEQNDAVGQIVCLIVGLVFALILIVAMVVALFHGT